MEKPFSFASENGYGANYSSSIDLTMNDDEDVSAKMLRQTSTSMTPRRPLTPKLSTGSKGLLTGSGTQTLENGWNGLQIDLLYPLGQSDPKRGQTTIPSGTQVIDLDEETANAIQDDGRFDRFESDYLSEAELEVFLRSQRRKLGLDTDSDVSEGVEADNHDAELVANLKRINIRDRTKRTASKTLPITEILHKGYTYRAGKCAELYDGSFLRINSIHIDVNGETWLVGDLLLRMNYQGSKMPKRRNELVWMNLTNDVTDASQTKRILEDASHIRKVRFTNQRFENLNTKTHGNTVRNPYDDVKFGELFCRNRRIQIISNNGRKATKVIEESIELIEEADVRNGDRIDLGKLRDVWRGIKTIPGGSFSQTQQSIILDKGIGGGPDSIRTQKYTYGDAFCGAGGTSRGAVMAGLKVKWAFDFDQDAVMTYTANFRGTHCYKESVADFLDRVRRLPIQQRKDFMVDILHISPPCQPFSSAHTIPNEENDAKNQAALFSVIHLIQVIKPRIVTIEETEGLLTRHDEWFSTLIHIFVYVGYSVRWKVLRCEEYGVPQMRRRLFICASGPGEKLPKIAEPTHGDGAARLVTIHDAISKIPRGTAGQEVTSQGAWPKPSHSAHTLSRTLTCGGGPPHPSGKRNFTLRELASLQTFPLLHSFEDVGLTIGCRQIGNAVPPLMAKTLYKEIIRSLQETDGVRGGR